MRKYLLCLFIGILYLADLFGQFTAGPQEFPVPGAAWVRAYGVWPAGGIGNAGPAQYYDFINAYYVQSDSLVYLDATATPFIADHPGSTIAKFTDGNVQVYDYYASDANAFWQTGITLMGDFGSGWDTLHGVYVNPWTDTLLSTQYTYGHTETELFVDRINIDGVVDVYQWRRNVISVDGWGQLETPLNTLDSVLRVKKITYATDSVFVFGSFNNTSRDTFYTVDYVAKGLRHPIVRAHVDESDSVLYFEALVIPTYIYGCTDSAALNYNPAANADDGSCHYCSLVSYSITQDTFICEGNSITLTISGSGNYNWNTGETTASIVVSPDSSQTYSVIFADTLPCWEQASVFVEVEKPVTASAWTNTTNYFMNDSVHFINLSQEADTWFWDFDDGGATSNLENPVHLFSNSGSHNVMLIASNGCFSDTFYIALNLVFRFDEAETGVSFSLFPNPSNCDLNVRLELQKASNVQLEVTDLSGRSLWISEEKIISAGTTNWNIDMANELPAGIYLVNIRSNESVLSRKWMKVK